jgi:membrane protein implicated in regulation of membrane protease activity
MWRIIGIIVVIFVIIAIVLYQILEARAIDKVRKMPPQSGIESLIGRTAHVVEFLSDKENKRYLRVQMDGVYWNAIAIGDKSKTIKVGDEVKVIDIKNLKLIVK